MVWFVLIFSLVLMLVPALALEDIADTLFDDGVSLLQINKRQHTAAANIQSSMQQQIIISPSSGALTFVGRHDVVRYGVEDVVRFDAAGFEVQFRVQGATEVKAAIAQEINGPGGWYTGEKGDLENEFEDGCMLSKKPGNASLVYGKVGVSMLPFGSQPHHFLVYVDGVPQLKPLTKSSCHVCTFDTTEAVRGHFKEYTIARGLDPSESHHIRIVKTSEPDLCSYPAPVPNWLALHSVILDEGFAQKPDPPHSRKIEFLGDSFMSGFCNTCKGTLCMGGKSNGSSLGGEPPDTYRWGSFALAWPHLLCEELQADCHATVLSGMGMHCNTHPPGQADCSTDETLPQYWQRTLASDKRTQWDFKAWIPDVFMIQISGNDHVTDPARDTAAVWATYERFVDTVYETFPNVHLVFVCGPYNDDKVLLLCAPVEGLVRRKKDSGAQIDMLQLSKIAANNHVNDCCGHPDEDYHKLIKDKAVMNVMQVMGWK